MATQSTRRSAANPYVTGGPSRYLRTSGGTSSVPVSGRTGATIDLSSLKGKTAPKGGSGGLESRQIPAAIQETGPEAMSVEGGEASTQPQMVTETQQPIENRGGSARYMIQGGGPKIDLSFLVPERANKEFDPSKAIGGENLPFQESKGVGGFFRRMLGDESNQQNIAAQQAQGAEWKQDARDQKIEDRLLNRMREADKPTQSRFEATQLSNKESEANRVAAENKRLELEGKRVGLTERQIEEARLDRSARLQAEKEDRDIRIENMRTQNALADYTVGQNQLRANQPSMTGLPGGGLAVLDPRSGSINLVNPGTTGVGTMPGTAPTTRQVYPPRTAPANTGGASVNRNDGSTMVGPLPPTTPAPENTALVPRFMQGAGKAFGSAATTATDPLRMLSTDIYKSLFSSGAQQDPEVLKRMKARQAAQGTENAVDYGPMF